MSSALRQYANFNGRATPAEYWWFYLFFAGSVAIVYALYMVTLFAGTADGPIEVPTVPMVILLVLLATTIIGLYLPGLAVLVRRLHDADKSGWWALLSSVPIAGIVVVVFLFLPGTRGPNRYGLDPRGRAPLPGQPAPGMWALPPGSHPAPSPYPQVAYPAPAYPAPPQPAPQYPAQPGWPTAQGPAVPIYPTPPAVAGGQPPSGLQDPPAPVSPR
ncbi:DUF805 domain-containing protein [Myceligenerans crystallogenes]|uniref:DUF805 domain-containing protein n=1 Tax=Myceligenerans crystallogenes TaxID=316335 RepID=UPI0031CEF41E